MGLKCFLTPHFDAVNPFCNPFHQRGDFAKILSIKNTKEILKNVKVNMRERRIIENDDLSHTAFWKWWSDQHSYNHDIPLFCVVSTGKCLATVMNSVQTVPTNKCLEQSPRRSTKSCTVTCRKISHKRSLKSKQQFSIWNRMRTQDKGLSDFEGLTNQWADNNCSIKWEKDYSVYCELNIMSMEELTNEKIILIKDWVGRDPKYHFWCIQPWFSSVSKDRG